MKKGMNVFIKINHLLTNITIGLLIAVVLNGYVCQMVKVSGTSMEPTFLAGSKLVMEKISYKLHTPDRFDVIVFPRNGNYFLVKRIIGMPNETVYINGLGEIFINGQLLVENYGTEKILCAGIAENTVTLGKNEYFVLGDNRNASLDSRSEYIGNVKLEEITGKIMR